MTDPGEGRENRDELDLDAETVRDLELTDDDADAVKGGRWPTERCWCTIRDIQSCQ
jgi:hypothetical protein